MPLFDQERIVKLVSELRKSTGRLQALSKLGKEDFLNDPDKIGSTKYHFIVGIEICIDMCNHVISRNGYRVPEDYGDTFKVMGGGRCFRWKFLRGIEEHGVIIQPRMDTNGHK